METESATNDLAANSHPAALNALLRDLPEMWTLQMKVKAHGVHSKSSIT